MFETTSKVYYIIILRGKPVKKFVITIIYILHNQYPNHICVSLPFTPSTSLWCLYLEYHSLDSAASAAHGDHIYLHLLQR